MRGIRALFVAAALAGFGCGDGSPVADAARVVRGDRAAREEPPIAAILADADARSLTPRLREALRSSDVDRRRVAAIAIARLHDPRALPELRAALGDPDARVRANASLGLGALSEEAPREAERLLLGALAAEPDPSTRAAMLSDLGRIASDTAIPALREGLASEDADVRAGACRGLGSVGIRERSVDGTVLRLISARTVDDPDAGVRLACAYALTRLQPAPGATADAEAVRADLERAASDESAEVRAMAVRALSRLPGASPALLAARASDPSWIVAVQAFRSLARAVQGRSDVPYATALRARLDRALAADVELAGPEAHVLLAAFEAAGPLARGSAVHGVATEALDRLGQVPTGEQPALDRALAHCAAAKLVDLGRGWPSRLERCGLGRVPEPLKKAAMAEVIGAVDGAPPQRATFLERLFADREPRVREAVLAAAPSVPDTAVRRIVLEALGSDDVGVLNAACEAVSALAPRWRAAAAEAASVRPAGMPAEPPDTELPRALAAAGRVLARHDDAEGLQAWLGAVRAASATSSARRVTELAAHPNPAVRAKATEVLTALEVRRRPGDPGRVPNPIAADTLAAQPATLRAVLETTRGQVEIELLAREAPATVARFVELAEAGYYDGLTFHRVVPAFVVQGGDPRGDGYGGPGWAQRCEDNRVPYQRGTVGMALAGRDTGGSQFFITHSAQPHLDGRYTAFGRVVRGMDVVDRLQVTDAIRRLRIRR